MKAKDNDFSSSEDDFGFLPVYEYGHCELPDGTRIEGNFVKEVQRIYSPPKKRPKIFEENGILVMDFGAE